MSSAVISSDSLETFYMDVGLDEIDIETVILSLRSESCFLGPGDVEVDDDDDEEEEETDFCVICDDGVVLEREDFPDCGHGKQFCEDCLSTFITGKITDSAISTLGCPFPGCKQRFLDTFLAAHTTENIFLKYKEVDGEMRKELSRNKYIKSFQNFFGNIYFEAANLFRRVVADCRRCPSCRYIIEKDGGCNHMTCRKCNHQFNWCCGSDYRYKHNDILCLIFRWAVPCLSIAPVILLVLYLFLKFYMVGVAFASFGAILSIGVWVNRKATTKLLGSGFVDAVALTRFVPQRRYEDCDNHEHWCVFVACIIASAAVQGIFFSAFGIEFPSNSLNLILLMPVLLPSEFQGFDHYCFGAKVASCARCLLWLVVLSYQSVSFFSLPTVIFLCLNTLLWFERKTNTANWYWKDTVKIMYLSCLVYSLVSMRVSNLNIDFSYLGLYMKYVTPYVTPSVGFVIQIVKCMGSAANSLFFLHQHYPLETLLPFLILTERRCAMQFISSCGGFNIDNCDSDGWLKKVRKIINDDTVNNYVAFMVMGWGLAILYCSNGMGAPGKYDRIITFFVFFKMNFILEYIAGIEHSFCHYFESYIYSKNEANTRYLSLVYLFSGLSAIALPIAFGIVSLCVSWLAAVLSFSPANILWIMGIGAVASAYLFYFVK